MKPAPGNFSIWSHQERAVFTRAMLSLLAIRWIIHDARKPCAGGVDHDDRGPTMKPYSTSLRVMERVMGTLLST